MWFQRHEEPKTINEEFEQVWTNSDWTVMNLPLSVVSDCAGNDIEDLIQSMDWVIALLY